MSTEETGQAERTEIRLALVLNGGVSLAVWMGGVTAELDAVRRASVEPEAPDDGTAFGFWQAFCRKHQRQLVIDVIAGTSAGGLNGAVLAASIGSGVPMPESLRQAWYDQASLTKDTLLKPQEFPESLLDGDFFQNEIAKIFKSIREGRRERAAQTVTLFLTATALGGRPVQGIDTTHTEFTFEDHRRLYSFGRDPDRLRYDKISLSFSKDPRDDFGLKASTALTTAARASAGFPVAFRPVEEDPLLAGDTKSPDGYRVWPEVTAREQPATLLMDGGVLDNAPFEPVLREIARRPVSGRYERVLAYLVPTSTMAAADPGRDASPITTVLKAAGLPREVDFRTDIEELDNHLASAAEATGRALYGRIRDAKERDGFLSKAEVLLEEYRRARAVSEVWTTRRQLTKQPLRKTLRAPAPIDADAVLGANPHWLPPSGEPLRPTLGEPWRWGITAARHVVLMLFRDVQEHLSKTAKDLSHGHPVTFTDAAPVAPLAEQLSTALAKLRALNEAVDRSLAGVSGGLPDFPPDATVACMLNSVFETLDVPGQLGEIVSSAAIAYASYQPSTLRGFEGGQEAHASEVVAWALAADVLTRAFAPPVESRPAPPLRFVRMGPDVNSPILPQYSALGDRKLYGTRVGHFGAFAARGARPHDWLMGRLDAAAHLVRLLAPAGHPDIDDDILAVQQRILSEEAAQWPLDGSTAGLSTEDLLGRLDAAHDALAGDNATLVRTFLSQPEGRTVATDALRSVLEMVSSLSSSHKQPRRRFQMWMRAALLEQPGLLPAPSPLGLRLLRGATTRFRHRLWSTVQADPLGLPAALQKSLRNHLILIVTLIALGGAGLGSVIAALLRKASK